MHGPINYLAVLVSAVVYFAIGGIWYTALAEPWRRAVGKTEEELKQGASPMPYVWSFICYLATALAMAILVNATGAHTAAEGLHVGLLGAFGLAICATAGDYFFQSRPRTLFFINNGFHLIGLGVIGAILAVWK